MQPRAFVVMPFGKRKPEHEFGIRSTALQSDQMINFDRIYDCLLKPALQKAGYEVARADSGAAAGDIRTDMFFELVTADLVVADITILNANVYYELGVRHGVCPRGVFVVNASVAAAAPFDVAPDRRFTYEASPFVESAGNPMRGSDHLDDAKAHGEVDRLSKQFRDASTVDRQTVGSPVYAHLPGLRPVDWENIETSRAKYFNALQDDWMDCVKTAQANGRPGDILTLARNAPTRMHEARILYETAIALTNLCRYAAAESILEDVVRLNPEDTEAQLHLALVAAHLGYTTAAEQRLRKILEQHKADPRADELLGQVFRYLWRLSWQGEADFKRRREKAAEASQLAISAIHSFFRAHRSDPRLYFAGFNALMLAFVLDAIEIPAFEISFGSTPHSAHVDRNALTALVRYTAASEQQQALEDGDYVKQFWCTTTLAGLLLIDGDGEAAIHKIQEACAIPAATSFQLQTFRDRLGLLVDLEVQTDLMQQALGVVEQTLMEKIGHCSCRRVVLWHGYGLDRPGRTPPRFHEDRVNDVSDQIKKALKDWSLNSEDLAICGGMTESDIIFAEACLETGARVRIMMRDPVATELDQMPQWPPLASTAWRERLHLLRVRDRKDKEVWIDTEHLGHVTADGDQSPSEVATRRHKQWLINTAKMEASQALRPGQAQPQATTTTLHGLFLWDGAKAPTDPSDSSEFVHEVEKFDSYQGEVRILSL
jgi:tetratricopeptide (TPR) repeat protein